MVLEQTKKKQKACGVCGKAHKGEEAPHRAQDELFLTKLGKVLPLVMIIAIFIMLLMFFWPYIPRW